MKLINATLRPGRVLEVLEAGNIKVMAPGLFNAEDKDNNPPVMPFFGGHQNAYSQPEVGDEIWVLSQSDNDMDLRWFRKDDYVIPNQDLYKEPECEVIVNRETGAGWASLYFTDGSGWVMTAYGTVIKIRTDGAIELNAGMPKRAITIGTKGISIGSVDGSAHPVGFGDKIEDCLNIISNALEVIKQAADTNLYTKPIGMALKPYKKKLEKAIPEVASAIVTVD